MLTSSLPAVCGVVARRHYYPEVPWSSCSTSINIYYFLSGGKFLKTHKNRSRLKKFYLNVLSITWYYKQSQPLIYLIIPYKVGSTYFCFEVTTCWLKRNPRTRNTVQQMPFFLTSLMPAIFISNKCECLNKTFFPLLPRISLLDRYLSIMICNFSIYLQSFWHPLSHKCSMYA